MTTGAEALATAPLEVIGLLPGSSNGTFLGRLLANPPGSPGNGAGAVEDGRGSEGPRIVYKPVRGEAPLWDFPEGTLAAREVAAFTLSRALGWPAVPPTVLRDGPLGPGAVQVFVRSDPAHHFFTLRGERDGDLRAVAAFDVLANNADRKGGHVLLGEDDVLWSIDHGLCFHADPKLRTVIWDFAGQEVARPLLDDVARVAEELRGGRLRSELAALLTVEEAEATRRRAEALCASGRYPEPGPGRTVPWPVI